MKALFDNYLKELFSKSNQEQVISVGLLVFKIILFLFIILLLGKPEILNSNGIWTLITALFSAPILFLIWRFRDQNATQQIENQRKDINLKEFQKIAEWVSGLHLVENEITEKESNDIKSEKTTKYSLPDESRSIPTFSKSDGAVGLQIAAIHSLLPFFRGEHGEGFRRPALNLLTSAWLSLQQKDLLELEKLDVLKQKNEFEAQIEKIKKRANSSVGVALTQVLLSDGGDNLLKFPEVFPNLCLAGMNFQLAGVDKRALSLFHKVKDCEGLNLVGANLYQATLENINLAMANLAGAELSESTIKNAQIWGACLDGVQLYGSELKNVSFFRSSFKYAGIGVSNVNNIDFRNSKLNGADLVLIDLDKSDFEGANLSGAIIDESLNHRISKQLKMQGGIVLYSGKPTNEIKEVRLVIRNKTSVFTHIILDDLNIIKTQNKNPDWEIFIEEIK